MRLTGQQHQQLTEALLDAFRDPDRLAQMVRVRLDKNLHAIATGSSLEIIVFRMIEAAEAEGWLAQLVISARESNPGNGKLFAFAQQFGLAPATPPQPALERMIRSTNSFLDMDRWRTRLGEIEAQVCRIEVRTNKGVIYGTGFLLGPDVVMTNHHVMEAVIEGKQGRATSSGVSAKASDVILRFDYKRLAEGTTLHSGTVFRLSDSDWLIDQSPNSTGGKLPAADELDYALLRVHGSPGNQPASGRSAEPGAARRKWIEVPTGSYDFQPHSPLFIVQHPQGAPLKVALDTDAIISVNANSTRVTYRTNTEPGSSGSPCFNPDWDLVALHHSGDPNFNPTYNEGIPFAAILRLLEQRNLLGLLGEQKPAHLESPVTSTAAGHPAASAPPGQPSQDPLSGRSTRQATPEQIERLRLYQILMDHFNADELREVCFVLGLDYDALAGDGKSRKVMELIGWFERRGRLQELVQAAMQERPTAPWT